MALNTGKKEYLGAVGRRKTAVAMIRLYPDSKNSFSINGKELEKYFSTSELQRVAAEAFKKSRTDNFYKVSAKVMGGGISAQAEAIRHGISRALLISDPNLRKKLKKAGFLKRDPR